ncbi:MAG: AIR synthase related protein, partial [Halapricum sp.]
RQYDHEVQVRTATPPGDDAAMLAIREASAEGSNGDTREPGQGLAISSGADPNWTEASPYDGARAVGLENATNIAAKGATPLAAVDCLNGGNPEKPDVYGAFKAIVDGLADVCSAIDVPVVGGNVSLYNDSVAGPIPPTPTLAMVGTKAGYVAPPMALSGEGTLLLVGGTDDDPALGGSELLARLDGSDRFPAIHEDPGALIETITDVADFDGALATHDVSHGGLAVTLAEMLTDDAGAEVSVEDAATLFEEQPGRVVVETTDPDAVRDAFDGIAPVVELGTATTSGTLTIDAGEQSIECDAADVAALRDVLDAELA